jgi:hypothetical protein
MTITEDIAADIVEQIKSICQAHNLWLTIESELKPDLKTVKCSVSIKLDTKTGERK